MQTQNTNRNTDNNQSQNFSSDFSIGSNSQPQFQSRRGFGYGKSGFFQQRRAGLSVFEIILVILAIFILVISTFFGFNQQDTKNRDVARNADIQNIISALNNFYQNSSLEPDNRAYPKATCSAKLNEVDYESSLRLALTGKKPNLDSHAYITPQQFPKDKSGIYSNTLAQRSVPYRCTQQLTSQNPNDSIYSDSWQACNFSQTSGPRNCYLYTSSSNGDTYELAYFVESNKTFIVYKKFRDQPITQRIET